MWSTSQIKFFVRLSRKLFILSLKFFSGIVNFLSQKSSQVTNYNSLFVFYSFELIENFSSFRRKKIAFTFITESLQGSISRKHRNLLHEKPFFRHVKKDCPTNSPGKKSKNDDDDNEIHFQQDKESWMGCVYRAIN